ncbi:hypothetical protein M3P05_13200 [Sansalvadorimonas sp. 2012CJ34-2]|uniref:Uncharacterized protein n=1 Tax=Parendozoicomonas callyspongiae TaxID=2942213 RepID=A0ABT0PHR4_9GAMM|nr:hypothetical protein [Sansalvadorimonas sp. 2012CJ34-2]MCL6270880.1 hypothetical protein [Sansalvadorimonas sp. 2012CJ34-2]
MAAVSAAFVMLICVQSLDVSAVGKPHSVTENGVGPGYHRPRLMPRNNQALIQKKLQSIVDNEGLPQALEELQSYGYSSGYLKPKAHTGNPVTSFKIEGYDLDFRYQINLLRSNYVPKYGRAGNCPICWDVVESFHKPGLRAYGLELNGRKWFLQNPPFPYTYGHVVMIEKTHGRRMAVREGTLKDGLAYLDLDPEATFCSNSSYYWSSASIPEHQHYQIIHERISGGGKLPVVMAKPKQGYCEESDGVKRSILNYPLPVIRLQSQDKKQLAKYAWGMIQRWEAILPGRNSVNLYMRKEGENYKVWILYRSTNFRNPKRLKNLKSENLGYLEVGGEFILPVTKDPEMKERRDKNPAPLFERFFKSVNPLLGIENEILQKLLTQPLPTEEERKILREKNQLLKRVKPGSELPFSQVKQRSRRSQRNKKLGA